MSKRTTSEVRREVVSLAAYVILFLANLDHPCHAIGYILLVMVASEWLLGNRDGRATGAPPKSP